MSQKTEKSYYEILGISSNASAKEIKQAYWALSSKHHPDKGGDENIFKRISEAYEVLSYPKKREMYDRGEDPDDFKNNKELAKERICSLVGNIIHHGSFMADHTDLIRRIREEINEISQQIYHDIENNRLLIRRYDSIIERINNADFIYAYVVETKTRIENKIEDMENDLNIQEEMHKLLEEAVYAVDPDKEMPNGKDNKIREEEER